MGLVYTGKLNDGVAAVPGTPAVQGVHNEASATLLNLANNGNSSWTPLAAGDLVSADQMGALLSAAASAADAVQTAIDDTNPNPTKTVYNNLLGAQARLAAATAAQDAAAIELATTDVEAAQIAYDGDQLVAGAAEAAALAAAVVGTPASEGSDAIAATAAAWALDNRLQINVDASAETSSGLTFGVRSRIRINENETGALSAPRVYMKSGAIEVAMGNIYGALDSMTGMYNSEVGLTALSDAGVVVNTVGKGDWGFDGYSSQGTGVNGVEAIYSAGAFTGHLSYTDSDLGSDGNRVAAYGAYTMNDWTVALGVQDSDVNSEDKTVLTVGGKVGDYGVGFAAADNDGVQKIALNGSATFGATTVNGFVADDESGTDTAYGLGVSYDLGGAAVVAGVERDAVGITRADMGVSFSF